MGRMGDKRERLEFYIYAVRPSRLKAELQTVLMEIPAWNQARQFGVPPLRGPQRRTRNGRWARGMLSLWGMRSQFLPFRL